MIASPQLLLTWECLECRVWFWAPTLGKDAMKHVEMDSEAVNKLVGGFTGLSHLLLEPWMLNLGKQILWVDKFTSFQYRTWIGPLSTKLCTWMKSSRSADTPLHVTYIPGTKMDFMKCPEDSKRSGERSVWCGFQITAVWLPICQDPSVHISKTVFWRKSSPGSSGLDSVCPSVCSLFSCWRHFRWIDWEGCLQPGDCFLRQEAGLKRTWVRSMASPLLSFTPKVTLESTFIANQCDNEKMWKGDKIELTCSFSGRIPRSLYLKHSGHPWSRPGKADAYLIRMKAEVSSRIPWALTLSKGPEPAGLHW